MKQRFGALRVQSCRPHSDNIRLLGSNEAVSRVHGLVGCLQFLLVNHLEVTA
jgi:hypothetical protein